MDIKRAIELLKGLADGVNPLTGEVLSPQDSCNQVEIVRALHCVIEHSKAPAKQSPRNAGAPWSAEEDTMLLEEFVKGASVSELTEKHARTTGAITSRLSKLSAIDNC